jgi:hypothetical protein
MSETLWTPALLNESNKAAAQRPVNAAGVKFQ